VANRGKARATIDRIERNEEGEPLAVLVFDDGQQLVLPLGALPADVNPGDVLDLQFQTDRDETTRRSEAIRRLQQQLFGE
jgi:hypothetical protein